MASDPIKCSLCDKDATTSVTLTYSKGSVKKTVAVCATHAKTKGVKK